MSDAPHDPYNWRPASLERNAFPTPASSSGQDDDAFPPDATAQAPREMPVLPRYGANGSNGANGAASSPSSPPLLVPPASATPSVSDLPTTRMPVTSSATPATPSVSDLPTARMPSVLTPPPAQQISDLPTARVEVATPIIAPPGATSPAPETPKAGLRPRALLAVGATGIMLVFAVLSVALLPALQPATSTSALYHQTLTAPADGWPNSDGCQFTASGYQVSGPNVCFYGGQDVRDASVSVTVTRASDGNDPSAGIAFRRTGPGAFYTFEIDGAGDWAVYKRGTILQQGENDAIKTDAGAKNQLEAQMKGSHYIFFVNGTQVAQADDAEFAIGKVGLTGYTGLEVVYTDFTIAPLR